jgi:L-threonylcarbamoyladenylate synthase
MAKTISTSRAAEIIRSGGVVAFPTETVYGLGANALDAAAVAKIYELKGRPSTSPLIVHVSSIGMARRYAAEWQADELAKKYWPGPLTIVVPKSPEIPDIVTAGLPTVGMRMPAHPVALELLELAEVPIAAPSANRFTHLSPTTAEHVYEEFGDKVEIVEGGASQVGIESTVVSLVGGKLTLLRPGMISLGDLESATTPAGAHPAPGMHERHYSPRTPLYLVEDREQLPDRLGVFVFLTAPRATAGSVRMPDDPVKYAARLYDVLHRLDREKWPWIGVEAPPNRPEWAAILDRLRRARSAG